MQLERRELLFSAAASAAAAAMMLPAGGHAKGAAMHSRRIPSSGEVMPVVGFGTWQTFDIGTDPAERAARREVLQVLFDAGGRMIDSSPMYGRSEAVVGDLLAGMAARDKAFLATKVWTTGEKAGLDQMRTSADRFRAPVIDLMQIHNLVDWRVHLKSLRAGKEAGRYRYIGITHYTVASLDDLAAILETERLDFVQMSYSLQTRAAERRLLGVAQARGVAVIVNQPFGSGNMFSKVRGKPLPGWAAEIDCSSWAQIMLKYLIGHPAVTCVIPGTARPDHARDNVAAGLGVVPDAAQRRKMADFWDAL
jgi:diketogulonate reductase-like aldo/keto reductase